MDNKKNTRIKSEVKSLLKESQTQPRKNRFLIALYALPALTFITGYSIGKIQQPEPHPYTARVQRQNVVLPVDYKIPDIEVIYKKQGNPGIRRL